MQVLYYTFSELYPIKSKIVYLSTISILLILTPNVSFHRFLLQIEPIYVK